MTRGFRIISLIILVLVCAASIYAALSYIQKDIDDPSLIVYFDHDEGYLMDMAWLYYSGEKLPSFQYEGDYGLELVYVAAFARIALSRFIDITPGLLVLIVRWLHLLAWAAALIAVWRLVIYHFGRFWQAFVVVLLLNIKLATIYFVNSLKPDPLVIFFMIIGIDYSLRIMGARPWGALTVAAVAAASAFVIKFSGVFLLPLIVISMYFCNRISNGSNIARPFPVFKLSWVFPAIIGSFLIAIPTVIIFFYQRRLSGITWYQQSGFFGSLAQNSVIMHIIAVGMILALSSFVCLGIRYIRRPFARTISNLIDGLNSNALTLLGLFLLFLFIVGFGWIVNPRLFIELYAITGREAFGYPQMAQTGGQGLVALISNFVNNVRLFDPAIFALLILYVILEAVSARVNWQKNNIIFYKRAALLLFLLPYSFYMSSGGRVALQHTIPFFIVMTMLALEGCQMLIDRLRSQRLLAIMASAVIVLLLCFTTIRDGQAMAYAIEYKDEQKNDVVFEISSYLNNNYPAETSMVAAHPTRVYVPKKLSNVKRLRYQLDELEQLKEMTKEHKPRLVYYNRKVGGKQELPPLEDILPGVDAQLVAYFDNASRPYARFPEAKFVIYEIDYTERGHGG